MQIKILNNIMVVTSALKASDIQTAKALCPQELKVKDDKGNDKFTLDLKKAPYLHANGIGFVEGANGDTAVYQEELAPAKGVDLKQAAVERLAPVADYINAIELALPHALAEASAKRTALANLVTLVD